MTDSGPGKKGCSPVWGCVLIGGSSTRMGRPKHLIEQNGSTWLEKAVSKLKNKVEKIVISGKGDIPATLKNIPVIQDDPGLLGPLAGILSVMRWNPDVSWVVSGCDQPEISEEAIDWLLTLRNKDIRAILPDLKGDGYVEPLLAYYDFRCKGYLEEIAAKKSFRISEMIGRYGVITPTPPLHLHSSWRNVNTPEEMG
ncbi:MAG: molybdenum cofactor guanylyltransferase [Desulfobulbaceae bacterium]|nr:molybdenum cofactor guanylyltransferase [Desulfobulbaceae bacterium]